MANGGRIAVIGASGHTGRFVVKELERAGFTPILVTRTGQATLIDGSSVDCQAIDLNSPSSLDRALIGADGVINCAGPFLDTAFPVVEAAIRAQIPYVDVTAEQWTTAQIFDRYGAAARDTGVTIVPAMAFFGGLADLLASSIAEPDEPIDRIEVAVGLDSWMPTAGTRKTGDRNVYQRLVVREGALVPVPEHSQRSEWTFPTPLGTQPLAQVALSEIILMTRHLNAREISSYMNLRPLADLGDAATPPPDASDDDGRSSQKFIMDVRLEAGGAVRRATAIGQDIYAVTAPLAVTAIDMALARPPGQCGVYAPGALFDARAFLMALSTSITITYPGAD